MAPEHLRAAYVLHTRPYRETSLLVDLFTVEEGRLTVVAKGARRPASRQRPLLQPFVPLQVSWRGRGSLKNLTVADAVGLQVRLQGTALLCGLYVNELLQRLLNPQDACPQLYLYYQYVLNELLEARDIEGALRTFERRLLAETGYGLDLTVLDVSGCYRFDPISGLFYPANQREDEPKYLFLGQDLLAIAKDSYHNPPVRQAAKRLMRLAIDQQMGGRPLRSRALFS